MKAVGIAGLSLGAVAAAARQSTTKRWFASTIDRHQGSLVAVSAGRSRLRDRRRITIGSGARSDIVIGVTNWTNASPLSILGASLESSSGVVVPLTISGSSSGTIPAGGIGYFDPILPSAFGSATFGVGTTWWYNVLMDGPFPTSDRRGDTGFGVYFNPSTTSVTPVNSPNGISVISGSDWVAAASSAFFVIGSFAGEEKQTWFGLGDSIIYGQGAVTSGAPSGYFGWFQRAMVEPDWISGQVASYLWGVPGVTATTVVSTHLANMAPLFQFASNMVEALGTNDLGSAGTSTTASALTGLVKQIWAAAKTQNPTIHITRNQLLVRVTSTDSYATEANQTYSGAGWQAGGNVDQFNQQMIASAPLFVDSVYRFTSPYGVDPWKWSVDGSANYSTADGLHPADGLHTRMATDFRAYRKTLPMA